VLINLINQNRKERLRLPFTKHFLFFKRMTELHSLKKHSFIQTDCKKRLDDTNEFMTQLSIAKTFTIKISNIQRENKVKMLNLISRVNSKVKYQF